MKNAHETKKKVSAATLLQAEHEEFRKSFNPLVFRDKLLKHMRDPRLSRREALICIKEQYEETIGGKLEPQYDHGRNTFGVGDYMNLYDTHIHDLAAHLEYSPMDWGIEPFHSEKLRLLLDSSSCESVSEALEWELVCDFFFTVSCTLVQMMIEAKLIPHKLN
jgi:hypothetical protein